MLIFQNFYKISISILSTPFLIIGFQLQIKFSNQFYWDLLYIAFDVFKSNIKIKIYHITSSVCTLSPNTISTIQTSLKNLQVCDGIFLPQNVPFSNCKLTHIKAFFFMNNLG